MDEKKKTPPPPRAEAADGAPRTAPPPREKKSGTAPPPRRGTIGGAAPPPRKSAGTDDGNPAKAAVADAPPEITPDPPVDRGQTADRSGEKAESSSQQSIRTENPEAGKTQLGAGEDVKAKPKSSLLKQVIVVLLVVGLTGGHLAYKQRQEQARLEKIEQEKKALFDLAARVIKLRNGLPTLYDQYDAALKELTALVPLEVVGTDEKAGTIFRQKLAFQFAVLAGGWRVEVFGDGGRNIELLKRIQADQELTLLSLARPDVPGQTGGTATVIAKKGVQYADNTYFGNDTFVPTTTEFSNYLDSIRTGPAPVGVPLFAFARAMDNGRYQEKAEIRQAYAQHPKGIVRIDDKATWERRQREIQRDLEERQRAEQKANQPKSGNSLDDALRKFKNAVRLN